MYQLITAGVTESRGRAFPTLTRRSGYSDRQQLLGDQCRHDTRAREAGKRRRRANKRRWHVFEVRGISREACSEGRPQLTWPVSEIRLERRRRRKR